ncbi:MAG TPA: hypothetical protein VMG99_02325 [Thermoplasmata archaeon]|nr:hypothetical protein [Thermoplasmata archaeon]
MAARTDWGGGAAPRRAARCRCGHLPTHHMVVVPTASAVGFQLAPTGPCAICGEAGCRRFQPAGPT